MNLGMTSPGDTLLAELGALIGLPELKADEGGCCHLSFDGVWLVTLVHVPATAAWNLSCPLAAPPRLSSGALSALLRANFMGAGCGGGSFSLAPDGKPCLQFSLPEDGTSAQTLLEKIERLLNLAETWLERLKRGIDEPDAGKPPLEWMFNRV